MQIGTAVDPPHEERKHGGRSENIFSNSEAMIVNNRLAMAKRELL
jgi:hypothetical protein